MTVLTVYPGSFPRFPVWQNVPIETGHYFFTNNFLASFIFCSGGSVLDTQLFCDRKAYGVTDCPVTSISVVTFCSSDSVPWFFPQVPCLAKCPH